MIAVIMAGGKGTRIQSIAGDIPKPMIPVLGKPVLEHQIICLHEQGINEIIIVIGHLGEKIVNYFNDGSKYGVKITYVKEEWPLGTAGGLWYLKEDLKEDFLLINGDIIFDINVDKLYKYHKKHYGDATILTHPNDHPFDSGIIISNTEGKVSKWLHKEDKREVYKNRVNAGIHMLSPRIFEKYSDEPVRLDLDRDILRKLIEEEKLYAYDSPEYVKDMGTPERYYMVEEDLKKGKVKARNLGKKQKAIFLDRDGTINVYKGFIKDAEDIELIDNVSNAIKLINKSGYLALVITNQPVIARGECSYEELENIHNKMETLLGKDGAYLDDIFYCPHHPDRGYEGEIPELKVECACRKPKPGLLLEAAHKYNIDLSQSYMVGDSMRDYEAGMSAGCKASYLIDDNNDLFSIVSRILL